MTRMGKVYLVGAGPGDPELLTRKALRLLEQADVVVYDRLVSAEILALANPKAVLIYAGKEQGEQQRIQAAIFDQLLHYASRASTIVRLKSGDPMVFGRGGEELEFLMGRGIECEVVPGISSAVAAPALAGIPVTYRGVATSFAIIAGHRESVSGVDWGSYRAIDTLIVLMGVEFRDMIAGSLIAAGRPASQPVAFIERASTDSERVVETTLSQIARRRVAVEAPAVMVIGEVVRLRSTATPRCATEVAA